MYKWHSFPLFNYSYFSQLKGECKRKRIRQIILKVNQCANLTSKKGDKRIELEGKIQTTEGRKEGRMKQISTKGTQLVLKVNPFPYVCTN